ncbi:MAG: DNA polymerase IV [Spirochaetaceae bacterium]|nr:DNA polymerase IV [Spirochaetaceae bacterium]
MACFVHADLDAFYAAVETLDHPEYHGKPVIVGGLPGDRRSVVATASYEARVFGVHSAMPIAEAVKRCPQGIFLRGNMRRYQEKSREIMALFMDFSPEVQQLSIDEAFLDISGMEGLFGPPEEQGRHIKRAVREKTGLTVSVGIASNKYLAKIASGISKPDGLCIIPPGGEAAFMTEQPVEKIWGAGKKTREIFRKHGFKTCADIAALSPETLTSIFGVSFGAFLYRAVRGEAAESFDRERGGHSMSAERTFEYDLRDRFAMESSLLEICQTVFWRVLRGRLESKTISVKIRYDDFTTVIVRETFPAGITALNDFYGKTLALFYRKYEAGRGVRLLGAGLLNLEPATARQGDLFGTQNEKERRLEEMIVEINRKFPGAALRRGAVMGEDGGRFGVRKE